MPKPRELIANWDISLLELNCCHSKALLIPTHEHGACRGFDAAEQTKLMHEENPAPLAAVYAHELRAKMAKRFVVDGGISTLRKSHPGVSTLRKEPCANPQRCVQALGESSGEFRQYVLAVGKAVSIDDDVGEVCEPKERQQEREAREENLKKEGAEAELKWRKLASEGKWDEVRTALEVYKFSGASITEDPRRNDAYREQVVKELGFGEDWKEKRPGLDEKSVLLFREVLDNCPFRRTRYGPDRASDQNAAPQLERRVGRMDRCQVGGRGKAWATRARLIALG